METLQYTPRWRGGNEPVTLVESPTKRWLLECKRGVRFSLLADGRIVFGDATTVLHKDICSAGAGLLKNGTGLVAGVLVREGGRWRFYALQYFVGGGVPEHAARLM